MTLLTEQADAQVMTNDMTDIDGISGTALVVDDDPLVVTLLSLVLERAGADVHKASSGFEALDILRNNIVDVVLSDISMEGMSGFDLVGKIRDENHMLEVVLITGHDSFDMVRSALRSGVYDYLVKPLTDRVEVVATVNRAINSVRLKRENRTLIERLHAKSEKAETANCRLTQLNEQLRELANTDSLTRLYNRRFIDNCIDDFINSTSSTRSNYSIVLLDVDYFKKINDTHGHAGGDKVLVRLAEILENATRQSDLVGRYGGEEFIVFMPGTDQQSAMRTAERLRNAIECYEFELDPSRIHITVSVGVASNNADSAATGCSDMTTGASNRALVERADKALYVSKNAGRNICRHFSQIDPDKDSLDIYVQDF